MGAPAVGVDRAQAQRSFPKPQATLELLAAAFVLRLRREELEKCRDRPGLGECSGLPALDGSSVRCMFSSMCQCSFQAWLSPFSEGSVNPSEWQERGCEWGEWSPPEQFSKPYCGEAEP